MHSLLCIDHQLFLKASLIRIEIAQFQLIAIDFNWFHAFLTMFGIFTDGHRFPIGFSLYSLVFRSAFKFWVAFVGYGYTAGVYDSRVL